MWTHDKPVASLSTCRVLLNYLRDNVSGFRHNAGHSENDRKTVEGACAGRKCC